MSKLDLRSQAKDILGTALQAVDPKTAVKKALRLEGFDPLGWGERPPGYGRL